MAITKDKKREVLSKLQETLQGATSVAFAKFHKLSVADASALRKQLKQSGVGYYVAKKTLIKRALEAQGYTGTLPDLPGEMAIAWSSEDPTAPHRGVYEFGRKLKGALTLIGGVFEQAYLDASGAIAIATIPSTPVLRGMFVNVIASPMQGLVIALDKIREQKETA